MSLQLATRTQCLAASETLAMNAQVSELRKQGESVISLGAGEPDFAPPTKLIKATQAALTHSFHYAPVKGIVELRTAIAQKLQRENNIVTSPDSIVVTAGAKQALFNLIAVLCDVGDECIVPTPAWGSYQAMIEVFGGVMVGVDTSASDFTITAKAIESVITAKTKLIIVSSPHNPTGNVISKDELIAIARLAKEKNVLIISDEVYEHFVYDGQSHFSLESLDEFKDIVCTVNSFSKSLGITGWRVGYCCGPKEIMTKVEQLQSHSTSNPVSAVQYGLAETLNQKSFSDFYQHNKNMYQQRRDVICATLQEVPGCSVIRPQGAFYVFVKFADSIINRFGGSTALAQSLLQAQLVATVPGVAFGQQYDNYLRLSFTLPEEELVEAVARIKRHVNK